VNDLLTPNVGDFVLMIFVVSQSIERRCATGETQTVRDFFK
jgi:hypothetical protein